MFKRLEVGEKNNSIYYFNSLKISNSNPPIQKISPQPQIILQEIESIFTDLMVFFYIIILNFFQTIC